MRRIIAPMSQVFAVEESAAHRIVETLEGLDFNAAFDRAQAETAAFNADRSSDKKPYQVQGRTAVVPVVGPMSKYYTCATWLIGGTASSEAASAIRRAAQDDAVDSIVVLVDSPGGEVSGTSDLGNAVFEARGSKKVVAVIEDMACSAGYWVASQAEEVWCNETAWVGNIGVYTVVKDFSKAAAAQGVKVTVVKSAERKGDGYPGTKVEDAAFAHLQDLVDSQHSNFVAAVARGRGISVEDAAALADGRIHVGADAVSAGLADHIGSLSDALSSLQSDGRALPSTGAAAAENLGEHMADTQEPKGFMDHMKAFFNPGQPSPEAATGGDGGHDENAALLARIDKMEAENAAQAAAEGQSKADAFVSLRVASGLIEPAEAEQAKTDFLAAWNADGGKPGALVAAVTRAYDGRQPSLMTLSAQIGGEGTKVLSGDNKDESKAAMAYAQATALGKKALEVLAKQ